MTPNSLPRRRAGRSTPALLLALALVAMSAVWSLPSAFAQDRQYEPEDAQLRCDHYVRMSMVQIDTAQRLHCDTARDDRLWTNDAGALKRACLDKPDWLLTRGLAERETALSACFDRYSERRHECGRYAEEALQQVSAASALRDCDISGPRWSANRNDQVQACLAMDRGALHAESDARAQQIASCTQRQGRREACRQYVEATAAQIQRNGAENCGLQGPEWTDDRHAQFEFCLRTDDNGLQSAIAGREAALQECHNRAAVDPECDAYAHHAERMARVADERHCSGFVGGGEDYRAAYQACLRQSPGERRSYEKQRRAALMVCSLLHGFKLDLGF